MIEGTIPTRTALVLQQTALTLGVSQAQLSGGIAVDSSMFGDDRLRVPIESAWRMWEMIGFAGGPGAGLCASAAAGLGSLGVWDYLFSSRPTLAESLRTVMELRSAVTDPCVDWQVIEDGGLLTVRVGVAAEADPVFVPVEEFVLALVLRRIREATGEHIIPIRVAFTHLTTARRNHLIDEFGTGRIEFGASHSEICFLDIGRLPTSGDPGLGDLLCDYARLSLASARLLPSWLDRFHAAVSDALTRGDLSLGTIATRLAVSPRTLQRRLTDLGTSWRDEVEQVRRQRATDLLRDTDLTVQAVAARVGYSDARALRRAFTQWTGRSPGSFRLLSTHQN
ncbi:AraC family transcriptional regulator [Nocardia sp. NBC_01503]|uniref:AraC family transcriptional regulator n=1 Tax=Nocardia sp. NBC_01503 TaxID=2975997 RepID=UPI002E7AB0B2|nr:helix-turn-helix domain-containing protein [Nocardia sp. NBC_01503]WTL30685.1 AraC family transcriptional regulator [Nocardia sp. NBC_01503]